MTHRRQSSYIRLLRSIKLGIESLGKVWSAKYVSLDFEYAAHAAFKTVLPETTIHGCNFHFNQALWKHVQSLGLVSAYKKKDNIVRKHIQNIAALAYVPIDEIDGAWYTIMITSPEDNVRAVGDFNDYFAAQWLSKKAEWNCYSRNAIMRTNNPAESWHRRLSERIKNSPSLWKFLSGIINEHGYQTVLRTRNTANQGDVRRVTTSDRITMVETIKNSYENGVIDLDTYLDIVGQGSLDVHMMKSMTKKRKADQPNALAKFKKD